MIVDIDGQKYATGKPMRPLDPGLDAELLTRHDLPGPRYTSYPTAPQFTDRFGPMQFEQFARESGARAAPRPLSLYVHVPFCRSPCLYCGCNRIITRSSARGARYVARLRGEIALVAPLFEQRETVQLHFGGGTPNFLAPSELGTIVNDLREHLRFVAPSRFELSIEIDPRFIQPRHFTELAHLGFNRVSLGVQDFDGEVQRAVNRVQSAEQTFASIAACRAAGIDSINIDLMYGLPRQTPEGFRRTLQAVVEARPTRVAVYGYAHLPKLFKAQCRIVASELPLPTTRVRLLRTAIDILTASGYGYIGMDHFALLHDDLTRARDAGKLQRNFMGYTTHAGCDLLGLGVSAISHVGDSFSQNPRDLEDWERAIEAGRLPVWRGLALDSDDIIRADVIGAIMCQGEVDVVAIERRYAIDFWTYFSEARRQLLALELDGLVWVCSSRVMATTRGRYLLRAIATCFDRYLRRRAATEPATCSRVV